MSVNLGSAHADIILDGSKAQAGVSAAVSALSQLDSKARQSGASFDAIGAGAQKAGTSAAQGMQAAAAAVQQLGTHAQSASQALGTVAGAMGIAGAGVAAGLGLAVKQAADLQSAVARISTIAPNIDTGRVQSDLSGLSTRVAQTSVQLAQSMNQIFSSIETNQAGALKLTEEFGKGAVAAGTDAETFGTAVLGVMNAYGLSVDQASHISDVFFNTLDKGVINGQQLATGLGQVTQSAKLAGVSFDELGALIAGVTREGGDAATNVNNLANVLNKIVAPPAQKALNDLGVATKDASGNFRSMIPILTDLKAKLDTLSEGERARTLQSIFPDVQARAGIAVLLDQLGTINTVLDSNANAAGKANAAYEKMAATASAQGQLLKNTLVASLTELGTIALPDLIGVAGGVKALVAAFDGLDPAVKGVVVHAAEFGAAFLLIGSAGIKVVGTVTEIASALRTLATAMQAAQVAGVGLTTALGGLAVAGIAAEVTLRALTGGQDGLVSFTTSILKYGDALHQGREDAAAFIAAHQDPAGLTAFSGEIATLQQHLNDLNAISAKFADPSFAALGDLLTGGTTKRNLEVNNLQKEIDALRAYQVEATRVVESDAWRKLHPGFIGPVSESAFAVQGPPAPPLPQLGPTRADMKQTEDQANALKQALTEMAEAQQKAFGDTQGALSPQNLAAMQRYVQVGQDAIPVIDAQAAAVTRLKAALEDQGRASQDVASAIQPVQAAFALLQQRQASGIPLTEHELALYGQIPGVLGAAQGSTEQLALAMAQTAIDSINAQGGIAAIAGPAGATAAAIDTLRGSLIELNGAFGALGQQDSQLQAFYNKFQSRIDVLQAQQKATGLDPAQQSELDNLLGLQKQIGDQLGINAAKERDIAANIIAGTQALKDQAAAAKAANDADLAAKSQPFANREDHRGEVALPPTPIPATPVPVPLEPTVDDASLAAVRAILAQPVTVPLTVDTKLQATGLDSATAEAMGIIGGKAGGSVTQTVTINAQDNASLTIDQIKQKLTEINQQAPNPTIGVTDNATLGIGAVTGALAVLAGTTATPTVNVADNASGPLSTILGIINSFPSSLNVTANVDTSGALAAIADLRAHMPSSPAEKGPFSTLPDWHSIFNTLGPAGDEAVHTLSSSLIDMKGALDSTLGGMSDDAAKAQAELVSSVAAAVKAAQEALTGLRSFTAPDIGRTNALRAALGPVMAGFAADAATLSKEARDGASAYAETVTKVVGAVSAATTALSALRTFRRPSQQSIDAFRDSAQYLIVTMAQVAADSDAKFVKAGADYAEDAQKVVSFVSAATAALVGLQRFKRPSDRAILDFRDSAQFLINVMVQVAADSEQQAVSAAADYAAAGTKVVQFVAAATAALTGLTEFVRPTDQAVQSFRDVAQFAMNLIAQVAADDEDQAVARAGEYSESALKVFQFVAAATTALVGLQGFVRPTDAAVRAFAESARVAVQLIGEVAQATSADLVDAAAKYSEDAQKVVALIGAGVSAFKALTDGTFAPPDPGVLRQVAQATRDAVLAIEDAARDMDARGVAAAGTYADGAGKVVALIGNGAAGFAALSTFTAPSAAQIQQFKSAVSATVIAIAQAAKEINADAVKSAGEYSDGAGKAVGLLGTAVSAFGGLKDFVAPSAEAITALVNVTRFAVSQLAGISTSFNKPQLEQLKTFGDAASAGFGAIRGALDAGKALADKDRIAPADAIGQALAEFQAGLGPLGQLAAVAAQYKATGTQIGADIAAAYASIAGNLPGFTPPSPQALALTANATTTVQQVVTVRHEPQTVTLQFLGENGTWIVKSLQVDGGARKATADLIAGEIADAIAAA